MHPGDKLAILCVLLAQFKEKEFRMMTRSPRRRDHFVIFLACIVVIATATSKAQNKSETAVPKSRNADAVPAPIQTLVRGFNDGDPEMMGTALSPGCEVRYVGKNGKAALGSKDRAGLVAEMKRYFRAIRKPRSKLAKVTVCGRFVSACETVSWVVNNKTRTQFSMVVFELNASGKEIARVWYYPAQTNAGSSKKPKTEKSGAAESPEQDGNA